MSAPRVALVHQLFESRVVETPEAIAVEDGRVSLTYRALDARATQLAHALREAGVTAESLVGLHVDRSVDLIVGVLGILKAGGAYVPVDVTSPPDRVAAIFDDAAVPVVVTHAANARCVAGGGRTIIQLDADAATLSARPTTPVGASITGENAAYVIYTSGSTGKPKGVVVTHQNVVRLFDATRPWFDFNATDVWTLFHSIAFDFSVWELWGALAHGGRLVIVPHEVTRSPDRFHSLLTSAGVTVLNQTPSAFRALSQADEALHAVNCASKALALRYVVFGGEALDLRSLRPWIERHGDESPQLINMYGITETTVHVTYRRIRRDDLDLRLGSVIGVPIPDLAVYLLDAKRNPVRSGEAGEIYVGGAGVARGYLNRPALTSERFLADPFSTLPRARMYRSGDEARQLPNGDLEYLGRLDAQVKIRGFRVELGEVESALRQLPGIGDAAVVARDDGDANKMLVAYYTSADAAVEANSTSLRSDLCSRLPEYLVPSRFVRVARIPLTLNGKVDHRELEAPGRWRPDLARPMVAPRTPAEKWLAAHWSAILNVDEVGVDDPFFELGGTSFAAVRLFARLGRETNTVLPALILFRAPTVAEMATLLSAEYPRSLPQSLVTPAIGATALDANRVADGERDELRERRMRRRNVR